MLLSTPSCLRTTTRTLHPEPMQAIYRTCTKTSSCRAASSLTHQKPGPCVINSLSHSTLNPHILSNRSTNIIRLASSAPTAGPGTSHSPADPSNAVSPERLDWNTFFKLRKTRRRYNLVASVGTSAGTVVGGLFILAQQDLDPLSVSLFGLDPMLLFGLTIAGFGTIGWLAGPFLGNATFRMFNSKFRSQMELKEREFYRRIKQHRVDPSSQSLSNPVPDYYGEKVSSVAGYRQWMKDQRAYNKKRQNFL